MSDNRSRKTEHLVVNKSNVVHPGIKRYNAVTEVYKNTVPDFDDRLMFSASGLWNFYLDAREMWKSIGKTLSQNWLYFPTTLLETSC